MPISDYLRQLRSKVGHDLLLVPTVTIVTFDEQQRVLLVRHAEGPWVLPGGSMDPGETPADAAVREMWEESGLLVEPVRILGVYGGSEYRITYKNGDELAFVMTVFECRRKDGIMQPDGTETLAVAYFSREELAHLPLPDWAHLVLADVYKRQAEAHYKAASWQPHEG